MTQTALPSFKEQLQQTLKFFSFKPSLYINSPRVNDTNKFMLFIILALVETFFHLIWYATVLVITSPIDIFPFAHNFNQIFNRSLMINITYLGLAMVLFCGYSLWVITRIPEQSRLWREYQIFFVIIYLIYENLFIVWIGNNSALEGVMLISATGLGMVLLRWRLVWVSFVSCIVALFIFNMSNSMNWWQLLPRLYPSLAARSHWLWGLSFSFLVTAKATVTLYCILQGMKVMGFQRRKIYDLLEADALTDIANRRTIYSFLSYLWERKSDWNTLSVIYIDLDKFKHINDEYGHDAGDATLICTANTLKNFLPTGTMFGRMGGEEFCIILPNTGIEQAADMAEQLRQAFEKQVVRYGIFDTEIQFTASLGIASVYQNYGGDSDRAIDNRGFIEYMREYMHSLPTMPTLPPALEQIIKFSDLAMQQAKANGRNCVVKGQCYLLMTQSNQPS